MKRFLVISLSVLLILPVLLVPCFAVSEYQFDFYSDLLIYTCPEELLPGTYSGVLQSDLGDFSLQQFDYLPDYLDDGSSFAVVTITLFADDVSYDIEFRIGYNPTEEISAIGFDGAETFRGVIYLTPVSSVESSLLSDLSSVASAVINWCSQIAQVILSRPLLLFTVGIFFLGGCIALFSRFLSRD